VQSCTACLASATQRSPTRRCSRTGSLLGALHAQQRWPAARRYASAVCASGAPDALPSGGTARAPRGAVTRVSRSILQRASLTPDWRASARSGERALGSDHYRLVWRAAGTREKGHSAGSRAAQGAGRRPTHRGRARLPVLRRRRERHDQVVVHVGSAGEPSPWVGLPTRVSLSRRCRVRGSRALEPRPFLSPTSKNPCPTLQVDPVAQVEEPLERRRDRLDNRVPIEQIVAGTTAGDEVGRAPDQASPGRPAPGAWRRRRRAGLRRHHRPAAFRRSPATQPRD
jgi:hypothetical protein